MPGKGHLPTSSSTVYHGNFSNNNLSGYGTFKTDKSDFIPANIMMIPVTDWGKVNKGCFIMVNTSIHLQRKEVI